MWRPALDALRLSLELREIAELRAQYERLREDHGFRILDYTVDADAASPRACFQFSEELPGKRTDFSPFVALAGQDKPALSAEEKQLCVEGLKHGERYSVTLRAGLPSVVKETLSKSADFTIYVRDRKPFVRFTGKAYVLPRTGQRGIPDRQRQHRQREGADLPDRRPQPDRHGDRRRLPAQPRSATSYERLGEGSAASRCGKASSRSSRRSTPTSPPRSRSTRRSATLQPGVYVMAAEPAKTKDAEHEDRATQWFIVSDLGLTAFSGIDGINVFVHSLATTEAKAGVGRAADRPQQRGPGHHAAPTRPASCASSAGSRAGRAGLRRRC